MAYKQPYKQVNKKQDGASILPALAAIPAIVKGIAAAAKIGKVAATAAKGIKVAATAAKAGKAVGTAAKAGKAVGTVGKAAKAASTAGKGLKTAKGAGNLAKVTTKGAKAVKTSSSMPKLQTLKQTAEVGKKGGKVFKKIGEAGKKALDKGKKIVEKGTEKLDKFKEGYDKVAGKVSDATGFDKDVVKEFGTNQASNAVTAIQNKIQGGGDEEMDPAERGTPSGITPMQSQGGGGYENPDGTSMFDYRKNHSPNVKSKYDNVGPSMKPITITNAEGGNVTYRSSKDGASVDGDGLDKFDIDKDNLFRNSFGDSKLSSFSAPITIKGVTFDAGDAIRLGILGYKGAKKGVENYKANAGERAMKKSDRQNNISKKERTKITADQNAENKRDARTKPNAKVKNSVLGNTKSVVQSRKKASEDMKKSDERRKKLLKKKPTPKKNTVVKRKLKVVDGFAGMGMPDASTLRIKNS
jgi:hypothetical protein